MGDLWCLLLLRFCPSWSIFHDLRSNKAVPPNREPCKCFWEPHSSHARSIWLGILSWRVSVMSDPYSGGSSQAECPNGVQVFVTRFNHEYKKYHL